LVKQHRLNLDFASSLRSSPIPCENVTAAVEAGGSPVTFNNSPAAPKRAPEGDVAVLDLDQQQGEPELTSGKRDSEDDEDEEDDDDDSPPPVQRPPAKGQG